MILARDRIDNERKLQIEFEEDRGLLEAVLERWETGSYVPIFVSEGTTDQKLKSIQSSYYLGTVYREVLLGLGRSLATFGWSWGEPDFHIIERLGHQPPERIAVSLLDNGDKVANMSRIRQIIKDNVGKTVETIFYDAMSVRLWEAPDDEE